VSGALYKSIEYGGDGVKELSVDDRLCIANMAIEAGAKNGIFPVDDATLEYLKGRVTRDFTVYEPDKDAEYESVIEIDLGSLEPTVALPHLPENTKPVRDVKGLKINQVVIGSCTNGRLSDMRIAAQVLKGKKVHPNVRAIIIPATQQIYLDMIKEGLTEIFVNAGAAVSTPTCGPCLGGHMGILAAGERAVATTNRNFIGRMGHTESEVYLASPAVAAACAVAGEIALPRDVV
jgi:3-isopropylmalate/(R)-2-methylmalate dehydratase large subunit